MKTTTTSSRGAALLTVLWLTAALTAIAFTLANTVRGEVERSSTDADGLKAYYLAAGAIDRTLVYMESGPAFRGPDGKPLFQEDVTRVLLLNYPHGVARVEYIPENSKLNVNMAPPRELSNLLLALGADPIRAQTIVSGILDWRAGTPGGSFSQFDQYYLSLTPSFRARHASLEEIEELLSVRGITPDIFYGTYVPVDAPDGTRLLPRTGLIDCLSVFGSSSRIDANTGAPAVLAAIGMAPDVINALVQRRRVSPL